MKSRENILPAYYRLAEDIKQQIESGYFKVGDLLPTEAQLGKEYAISRMTVRKGVDLLVKDGLLKVAPGKGTWVTYQKLNRLIIDLTDSFENHNKFRYRPVHVNLLQNIPQNIKELWHVEKSEIIAVKRLIFDGCQAAAIEELFISYREDKPFLENELIDVDFPELVMKYQEIVPVRNDVVISIDYLSVEQAKLLETEELLPAFIIKQVIYSKEGSPLGISVMVCHKDRFNLKATSC